MPARNSITLFHVRGIRIGVDYSWFFILFLIILSLSGFYKSVLGPGHDTNAYLLAVASAIAFFGSILLHELGHALVAIRHGIAISEIGLWFFGGVARMNRDSDSAGTEFKIAVAGPLVTLAIALACIAVGIGFAGADEFWKAMRILDEADTSGVLALVAWLAFINLLVLGFNLIPAFPLDGGRIARAIVWRLTGDRNRATRFAALMGQAFSYVFIMVGLLLLIYGDPVGGIWLALIGFILGQSARSTVVQAEFATRIEGISVGGLIDRGSADAVPEPSRTSRRVADVFAPDASGGLRVRSDAPLEAVLGNENLRRLGALVAVDEDGRLKGVITADQVSRALRDALAGGHAA